MPSHRAFALVFLAGAALAPITALRAQETGTIRGTVTRSDGGAKLSGVSVQVRGTGLSAVTGVDGGFTLSRVPAGQQTLLVRWVGFRPQEVPVVVPPGATATAEVALESQPIMLSEIIVSTASRAPERVVEAPAAVTLVDTRAAQGLVLTGQAPLAIANVPGVDVVQSGMNDINLNTRGFNTTLNRRVLVLQDGRDLAVAFLGAQEWNALSASLDDMGRIEMVRGPGSALYGANAFSGVLSITTPAAREVVGTKLTLGGGELRSFRGDLRHAGLFSGGQFGYKITGGYSRSDTWSRSRTAFDSLDMRREYAGATDTATVAKVDAAGRPAFEAVPLNGQTITPTTGVAVGDRKDLVNMYGTGRLDHYATSGAVGTLEGGASRVQNEVFVTGIGRVQIIEALRPWARLNWGHPNYTLMAWYSGRRSPDSTAGSPTVSQRVLASNNKLIDLSSILHLEAQYNHALLGEQLRGVIGASFRDTREDTRGTLINTADDNRSDKYYSGYGQLDYRPASKLRLVAAGRVDAGTLFDTQFSPKLAVVVIPKPEHSFRFTVNRAFQTPNYSEFFLRVPVSTPQLGPRQLELGLEQFFNAVRAGLPPAQAAAVPTSLNWDFSTQTQALAFGNPKLESEKVTGLEFGYKGELSNRVFVTADFYYNILTNFVTDLLPGVNPDYPVFSLTSPVDVVATLNAIDAALAAGGAPPTSSTRLTLAGLRSSYQTLAGLIASRLATLPDGQRAIVVSYTNAGKVNERGVELGVGVQLSSELKADASYTFFDFDVVSSALGDQLLPNTAKHKGSFGLSYNGRQGFDAGVQVRFVDRFQWAAGVFSGIVPSSQTINLNASYQVNRNLRIQAVATNLLDQKRFQLYGGSVIGRRVLGGVTATF